MNVQLPRAIAGYFEADRSRNSGSVADWFSRDAVVQDEGSTHTGRDAIRRWKEEASTAFSYTVEPFAVATHGSQTVVTSHVVGDFPGSPIDLRYFFVVENDRITRLEIVP